MLVTVGAVLTLTIVVGIVVSTVLNFVTTDIKGFVFGGGRGEESTGHISPS